MIRKTKLNIFLVTVLLLIVIVYFSWAIVATYVLTDFHNNPDMDIRATDVTFVAGSDRYNEALTKYDFGLISAGLDKTQIISDTIKPNLSRSIEYADYDLIIWNASVESTEKLSIEQKTYERDLFKCMYQVTPSDLFSFNSLRENLWITQCLIAKAIGSPDGLKSVEHIDGRDYFAAAYLHRRAGRKPMIELIVFGRGMHMQSFVFKSKSSDDTNTIQVAYRHFIQSMSKADDIDLNGANPHKLLRFQQQNL